MQTFINFHSKLSVSHVRLDNYKLSMEPAHVLALGIFKLQYRPRELDSQFVSNRDFNIS